MIDTTYNRWNPNLNRLLPFLNRAHEFGERAREAIAEEASEAIEIFERRRLWLDDRYDPKIVEQLWRLYDEYLCFM